MAIPSAEDHGSPASAAYDALTGIVGGLHDVAASMYERATPLLKAAIGFVDFQMLAGIVIGAGAVLLLLLPISSIRARADRTFPLATRPRFFTRKPCPLRNDADAGPRRRVRGSPGA